MAVSGCHRGRLVGPALHRRAVFHIGGKTGAAGVEGQIYVEHLTPGRPGPGLPVIFFHGAALSGACWLTTPDGRPGWADHFLAAGHEAYLLDLPGRGRSGPVDAPQKRLGQARIAEMFVGRDGDGNAPMWPGGGRPGDPEFDALFAATLPFLAEAEATQRLTLAAGRQLIARCGPCVLLTHSQAGPIGWLLADAMPGQVRAIIAVEPSGPPFGGRPGAPPKLRRGIADLPLRYRRAGLDVDPPEGVLPPTSDGAGPAPCILQREPVATLANLAAVPVLIVTAELSYHARYDHCTAAWLRQAGVATTHLRLEQVGLRGNGHLMMVERNNGEIAQHLLGWLRAPS